MSEKAEWTTDSNELPLILDISHIQQLMGISKGSAYKHFKRKASADPTCTVPQGIETSVFWVAGKGWGRLLPQMTSKQPKRANTLIWKTCCNYGNCNCIMPDDGEECVCPQTISYSILCKWFRNAVLSTNKALLKNNLTPFKSGASLPFSLILSAFFLVFSTKWLRNVRMVLKKPLRTFSIKGEVIVFSRSFFTF